ncbi:MAG: hypothetical protein V3W41_10170 [Planctomycetota bacterium]
MLWTPAKTEVTVTKYIALIAALAFSLANAHAQLTEKSYQPVQGEVYPDFVLPSVQNGSRIALSDFRGSKVLLLHFASW